MPPVPIAEASVRFLLRTAIYCAAAARAGRRTFRAGPRHLSTRCTPKAATTHVGVAAKHEDESRCAEVTERQREYVDGTANRVNEGRFGGAFLQPLQTAEPNAEKTEPGPEDLENYWDWAADALADEIPWLKIGDFLAIDYDSGNPEVVVYGQLAVEYDNFHCEVVFNAFMPADDWPLVSAYFVAAEWTSLDDQMPNWHRVQSPAAAVVLAGLRQGRGCHDPRKLDWEPATFPGKVED